jgi:hypothetical protein
MTAQELHTRLGRILDDGFIRPTDEVFLGGNLAPVQVTGLEAPGVQIKLDSLASVSGCLMFGRVVP